MTIDIIADDGCEYISQQLLDTFGVVSGLDGKNVYLMQLPFLSGTLELPCYEATGIDMSGHYYQIVWSILQGHEDNPDESDVADWHSPTTVTAR